MSRQYVWNAVTTKNLGTWQELWHDISSAKTGPPRTKQQTHKLCLNQHEEGYGPDILELSTHVPLQFAKWTWFSVYISHWSVVGTITVLGVTTEGCLPNPGRAIRLESWPNVKTFTNFRDDLDVILDTHSVKTVEYNSFIQWRNMLRSLRMRNCVSTIYVSLIVLQDLFPAWPLFQVRLAYRRLPAQGENPKM